MFLMIDGFFVFGFVALAIYGIFGKNLVRSVRFPAWMLSVFILAIPFYMYCVYLSFTTGLHNAYNGYVSLAMHGVMFVQIALMIWVRRTAFNATLISSKTN